MSELSSGAEGGGVSMLNLLNPVGHMVTCVQRGKAKNSDTYLVYFMHAAANTRRNSGRHREKTDLKR